jgi:hypothetical protein
MAHRYKKTQKSRPHAEPESPPQSPTSTDVQVAEASKPTPTDSGSADFLLLETLFHELFQTETSAQWHPQREARRLGEVPPARALRAVSVHATAALQELPELARKYGLPVSGLGTTAGFLLSTMRQWVLDRLIEPERSYRGTLGGMRHGVDLVELISQVAQAQDRRELAQWCARWLSERRPLVEAVAAELMWFAQSPEAAVGKHGRTGPLHKLRQVLGPTLSQAQA